MDKGHNPKTLSGRIAIVRDETGLSQAEIGRRAGATKGLVTQWIKGPAKSISYEHASNLERELGYASRWLITGEGQKIAPGRTLGVAAPHLPTTEELHLIDQLRRLMPDQLVAMINRIEEEAKKAGQYEQEFKRRFGMASEENGEQHTEAGVTSQILEATKGLPETRLRSRNQERERQRTTHPKRIKKGA